MQSALGVTKCQAGDSYGMAGGETGTFVICFICATQWAEPSGSLFAERKGCFLWIQHLPIPSPLHFLCLDTGKRNRLSKPSCPHRLEGRLYCMCHTYGVPFSVVWAVCKLHVLFLGDLVACPDALTLHELTCLIRHFI